MERFWLCCCQLVPQLGFGRRDCVQPVCPTFAVGMWGSLRTISRRFAQKASTGPRDWLPAAFESVGELGQSILQDTLSDMSQRHLAHANMNVIEIERKSVKRKAAEALLQSRYLGSESSVPSTQESAKRRYSTSAYVAACPDTSHPDEPVPVSSWCNFAVSLPHINWNVVASARLEECTHANSTKGRSLPHYQLPGGISIYIVDRRAQISEALDILTDSMQDSLISIDLEWRPDYVRDTSKVALIQLSSATCCLLLRTCKMNNFLPDDLLAFFR